jgi:hypothetical protein
VPVQWTDQRRREERRGEKRRGEERRGEEGEERRREGRVLTAWPAAFVPLRRRL